MIHDAITEQFVRDWAGTDSVITWYEYEIRPSPSGPDDFVERFAREATEHSAQQKGLALVGDPLIVRSSAGNLLVLWATNTTSATRPTRERQP